MTEIQTDYKSLNSPIKWVGGKSRLRKYIIPLIPPHTCFVDLFGGGGWVLFGKVPSEVEIFNDFDDELINFFRVVKYNPEKLIESFDLELVSRSEFNRLAGCRRDQHFYAGKSLLGVVWPVMNTNMAKTGWFQE